MTPPHDKGLATISAERATAPRQAYQARRALRAHRVRIWAGYAVGGWSLLYAAYRGYYALGGTVGMIGTPVSWTQWRQINAVGAVLLVIAGVLALSTTRLWHRPYVRTALLALCWVAAVGCVMHALIDMTQRVLSLSGLLTIDLPHWVSKDQRVADLQDLLWNEPWFLIEGVLWGALGWTGLNSARSRRWWLASALVAIAVLTANGLLTAFGVTGRVIVG